MISNIPDRLKTLRQTHGYSQDELAGKILVTRQAISKWERGDDIPSLREPPKLTLLALGNPYCGLNKKIRIRKNTDFFGDYGRLCKN